MGEGRTDSPARLKPATFSIASAELNYFSQEASRVHRSSPQGGGRLWAERYLGSSWGLSAARYGHKFVSEEAGVEKSPEPGAGTETEC